jgi:glycosyltransferase involved in cell wall biosynthesis
MPMISICCITYNHEKFIAEALDSFLMQKTKYPFEIVVGEDKSTDGMLNVLNDYRQRYPNIIKLITSEKNVGANANFFRSIGACKGEFIALCEGDDFWRDDKKLERQVTFLRDNPEYVITFSDCQPFGERGPLQGNFGGALRDLSKDDLKRATPIYTLTACFRNVIKEFPPEMELTKVGDLFLWSLLGHHGKGKFLRDAVPAGYRIHAGGVHSSQSRASQMEASLITINLLMVYYYRKKDQKMYTYFKWRFVYGSLYWAGFSKNILLTAGFLLSRIKNRFVRWRLS